MLLTLIAAMVIAMGPPVESALARDCEDICADRAAENCEDIDSITCAFYIWGCLSGCSLGQILVELEKQSLEKDELGPWPAYLP